MVGILLLCVTVITVSAEQTGSSSMISWSVEPADSPGDVGSDTSMAIFHPDIPVIVYDEYTGSSWNLKYAFKQSSTWTTGVLQTDVQRGPSITVDSSNGIHIATCRYEGFILRYPRLTYFYAPSGGSFTSTTLDTTCMASNTAIRIDYANTVHIAYYNYEGHALKYAFKPISGGWTVSTADPTVDSVGGAPAMVIDHANGVHIVYADYTNDALKYAYKPSWGFWSFRSIDSMGGVTPYGPNKLAIDSNDNLHLVYYSETTKGMRYAYKDHSGLDWMASTVVSGGNFPSIAVDSSNGLHVAYRDKPTLQLNYISKPSGGSWTIPGTIDSVGDTGLYTSTAIDTTGHIHVSYYDNSSKDLKYARSTTSIVPEFNQMFFPMTAMAIIVCVVSWKGRKHCEK